MSMLTTEFSKVDSPYIPVPGDKVSGYSIVSLLGQGSYGHVFKAKDGGGDYVGLKIELTETGKTGVQQEVKVLKRIREEIEADKVESGGTHFCSLFASGTEQHFEWMSVTLLGLNVVDLLELCSAGRMRSKDAVRMAHQSFDALVFLHDRVGYLHRDVKPQNMTIGLGPYSNTLYLIDFGQARCWMNTARADQGPRPVPDKAPSSVGTCFYAGIRIHEGHHPSRASDMESWMYSVSEMFGMQLPWESVKKDKFKEQKISLRDEAAVRSATFKDAEPELLALYEHIVFAGSVPDYTFINAALNTIMSRLNVHMGETYEWQERSESNAERGTSNQE